MICIVGSRKKFLLRALASHLKECFGTRSAGLQHDGQNGEDDDLDGCSTSVPVGPRDAVLQKEECRSQSRIHHVRTEIGNRPIS